MIEEGGIKIYTSATPNYIGPGKKKAGFYNPTWKFDRDLQILFCKYAYEKGAKKFLDGMAATGIRGIRIKKEIKDIEMDINDSNKLSYQLILKNVRENGIEANVLNEKFCSLLFKKKYDYVDLDPYGSPSPYIPCIFNGIRKKAFISISATDTATLNGIYKKACIRKYGAIPLRMQGKKEIGLRILIGYIARIAATYEYSFIPKISYSYSHYFRIYGCAEKGAKKADESIEKIGWIYWENGWKIKRYEEIPSKKFAGPLWIGNLHDESILKKFPQNKMIKLFIEENSINLPYYESSVIAKELKSRQPPMERLIEKLRSKGYNAARTHFGGGAFKTDAPYDVLLHLF